MGINSSLTKTEVLVQMQTIVLLNFQWQCFYMKTEKSGGRVHILGEDTYVLTIEPNPVGDCQSIDKDSKESLVVGICNAH